jgi:arylsulfatase A-like enzyme
MPSKIQSEGLWRWLKQGPVSFRRHLLSAGGLLCFGFLGNCSGKASGPRNVAPSPSADAGTIVALDGGDGRDAAVDVATIDARRIADVSVATDAPRLSDTDTRKQPDSSRPSGPPNILLIVADDVGYSDIGAFGGEISTPNLDALVGDGRIITNFHTGPVSAVTRSMLMSGTDHHLVGLGTQYFEEDDRMGLPGYEGYLNNRSLSIAELLKEAGYHTYISGKWHLGYGIAGSPSFGKTPDRWGFERSFALLGAAALNHFGHEAADSRNYTLDGAYVQPGQPGQPGGEGGTPSTFYTSDFFTQKMIEFIESNRGDGKPFFAYAAYNAVHAPLQVPEPWLSQYRGKYDQGYDAIREARMRRLKELDIMPPDAVMYPGAPETLTQSPATANWEDDALVNPITASHSAADGAVDYHEGYVDKKWQSLSARERKSQARYMEIYAGMLSNLDHNVGLLIQYLKDIGEYDRTFIMFLSDNGPEALPNGLGANPKFIDEAYAAAGVFETLGTDNGEAKAEPLVVYGMRWAEVSATPFAQTKQCTGEGGTSVPAIVRMPGQTGSLSPMRVFTHATDVAPTLLALAGATPPSEPASVKRDAGSGPTQEMVVYKGRTVFPITGQSFLPVLRGEGTNITRKEAQFGEEIYGRASIYSQDLQWKARFTEPPLGPLDGHWELFDLENDRAETTDLSAKYPDVLNSLKDQWRSYMTRVGGVEPSKPNGYY